MSFTLEMALVHCRYQNRILRTSPTASSQEKIFQKGKYIWDFWVVTPLDFAFNSGRGIFRLPFLALEFLFIDLPILFGAWVFRIPDEVHFKPREMCEQKIKQMKDCLFLITFGFCGVFSPTFAFKRYKSQFKESSSGISSGSLPILRQLPT